MKFPLQYAKILSQKYLNIDDDIIPEIEMCLEREGDKVSLPFEVENFGTAIKNNISGYGDGSSYGDGFGDGDGDSDGDGCNFSDGLNNDDDFSYGYNDYTFNNCDNTN